jgi:hypothetical protein
MPLWLFLVIAAEVAGAARSEYYGHRQLLKPLLTCEWSAWDPQLPHQHGTRVGSAIKTVIE